MIRGKHYVHRISDRDTAAGNFECPLGDARNFRGEPLVITGDMEIENNLLWVGTARPTDSIPIARSSVRVAEQEIQGSFVLERIAQVGRRNTESLGRFA